MYLISVLRIYFWVFSTISYQIYGAVRQHDAVLSTASKFIEGSCLDINTVFSTTQPSGLAMCIKTCLLQPRCEVICFHKLQLTCMLGYERAAVETNADMNFITNINGFLASVPTQQLLLSGECQANSCPVADTCMQLQRGGKACITTAEDICDPPPVIPNTYYTPNGIDIPAGFTIIYQCMSGYAQSGYPPSTCLANNQWTPTNFTCTDPYQSGYEALGSTSKLVKVYNDNDRRYQQALDDCQDEGAGLARITEPMHGQSMMSKTVTGLKYFIDGFYDSHLNAWVYNDGSYITSTLMSDHLSSTVPGLCTVYTTNGLEIEPCENQHYYICEMF